MPEPMNAQHFAALWQNLEDEIAKNIIGHKEVVRGALASLFAGGHCLLEGAPGLGKTVMVRSIAASLALEFSRIQFTPDLMPADITGANVLSENKDGQRELTFRKGPLFSQVVLADEINRATPKTQSALLEAMAESTITAGGKTHQLSKVFFVLATQNPIEMEGTYPLPEAQLDRFMLKLNVPAVTRQELQQIAIRTTSGQGQSLQAITDEMKISECRELINSVIAPEAIYDYAARLILALTPNNEFSTELANKYIRYGSSPRGIQAMICIAKVFALAEGRCNIDFSDIKNVAPSALRHRLIMNFEGDAEGIDPDALIADGIKNTREILE